jgi:hypothetical protein
VPDILITRQYSVLIQLVIAFGGIWHKEYHCPCNLTINISLLAHALLVVSLHSLTSFITALTYGYNYWILAHVNGLWYMLAFIA